MRLAPSTLAFLTVLGIGSGAQAHVPNIATFELLQGAESSRLGVHMSTDGMHHVMQKLHPGASFAEMSPEDYSERVVAALRGGIELRYDDQRIALGEAEVSLAPHQSDVVFQLPAPPEGTTAVHARIDVMREQHNQHNVFRLVSGSAQEHVVLSEENAFRGALKLRPASADPSATLRLALPILALPLLPLLRLVDVAL